MAILAQLKLIVGNSVQLYSDLGRDLKALNFCGEMTCKLDAFCAHLERLEKVRKTSKVS